jgi:pantetheine-phosphate adenylyltransferase
VASAIYAGSFDPVTHGHIAIIRAGLLAFDHIVVAVTANPSKTPMFSSEERMEMVRETFLGDDRVEVDSFGGGLLVDYAAGRGVYVLLRGLRPVGDFDGELQMAAMNRNLAPGIVTVFIPAADHFFVSSSLIKEVASLGGAVSEFVPEAVERRLRAKFAPPS